MPSRAIFKDEKCIFNNVITTKSSVVGVNHKIYSCHVVKFVFTLTKLIKNLQHDSRYTCKTIREFDFDR